MLGASDPRDGAAGPPVAKLTKLTGGGAEKRHSYRRIDDEKEAIGWVGGPGAEESWLATNFAKKRQKLHERRRIFRLGFQAEKERRLGDSCRG
jgi:hypothetical protein